MDTAWVVKIPVLFILSLTSKQIRQNDKMANQCVPVKLALFISVYG